MPPFDVMVTECREDAENRFPMRSWRYWFRYEESIWLVYVGFWFIQPALGHEPLSKVALVVSCPRSLYSDVPSGPPRST